MTIIGQFIKDQRTKEGLSLSQLGKKTGVSDSEIHRIENGFRENPNWEILCKIAIVLKLNPISFMIKAGYISSEDLNSDAMVHGLEELSRTEIEEVQLFINFMLYKSHIENFSKGDV